MAKRSYVLQQSRNFWVVESDTRPDTTVPDGEKRKVIRMEFADRATADQQGKALADAEMGNFKS